MPVDLTHLAGCVVFLKGHVLVPVNVKMLVLYVKLTHLIGSMLN